jgi:hypothetical protein
LPPFIPTILKLPVSSLPTLTVGAKPNLEKMGCRLAGSKNTGNRGLAGGKALNHLDATLILPVVVLLRKTARD